MLTPRARPTLIGLPYDAASSFARGAAEGPRAVRAALRSPHTNLWTEGLADLRAAGALDDAGDVAIADPEDGAAARQAIERRLLELLRAGRAPIALGGDHSVTLPAVRAARQVAPRLTIVHFDAHPDLYDEFEGDRFSHACPFARIMEEGLADRLIQVGVRAATGHQRAQAERFGVEVIDMDAWAAGRRADAATLGPPNAALYLSIDLDVLDPAFAPGVSHHEPGGLSVRELLSALHAIAAARAHVVAADVVELNPARDVAGATAAVAAKVVKEVAGMMLTSA